MEKLSTLVNYVCVCAASALIVTVASVAWPGSRPGWHQCPDHASVARHYQAVLQILISPDLTVYRLYLAATFTTTRHVGGGSWCHWGLGDTAHHTTYNLLTASYTGQAKHTDTALAWTFFEHLLFKAMNLYRTAAPYGLTQVATSVDVFSI